MRSPAQTTVWGTPIGLGRASGGTGWLQQLRAWWAAHQAARRQTRRAALSACWDAQHKAVRAPRADAASEMAAARAALSVATLLYGLSQ